MGCRGVVDVKTTAVQAWVAEMVAEGPVPRRSRTRWLLRQVLGAAVEDRRIPRNPCEGVQLPKRKHADRGYLSHAQVAALAEPSGVTGRGPIPGLHGPAVGRDGCAAGAGLRHAAPPGERVAVGDRIRRLVWSTPKSWERRSVPFPASIADELSALMVGKARDELVFTDGGVGVAGQQLAGTDVRASHERCRATTRSPPSRRTLRHTAVSLAVGGRECQSGAADGRAR